MTDPKVENTPELRELLIRSIQRYGLTPNDVLRELAEGADSDFNQTTNLVNALWAGLNPSSWDRDRYRAAVAVLKEALVQIQEEIDEAFHADDGSDEEHEDPEFDELFPEDE
jgi:hypothetical protein